MDVEKQELPFSSDRRRRIHQVPPSEQNPSSYLPLPPPPPRPKLHQRGFILCCGCCSAIVLILAVILLALTLTLFKVKEPHMTMHSISINSISSLPTKTTNASLTFSISVKNSNLASFRYAESTTVASYREMEVGHGVIPAGAVPARQTRRVNTTVVVLLKVSARDDDDDSMVKDGLSGNWTMNSYTKMDGSVNFIGMFKKHIDITMNCSVITFDRTILTQNCRSKVHL